MNAPLDPSLLKFGIGQPVPRKEDPVLLRGEGRFTDGETARVSVPPERPGARRDRARVVPVICRPPRRRLPVERV